LAIVQFGVLMHNQQLGAILCEGRWTTVLIDPKDCCRNSSEQDRA
jgi:hypothetical protein